MSTKPYDRKRNEVGDAALTVLAFVKAGDHDSFVSGGDGDAVLVCARGVRADRLSELVSAWGGEVERVDIASDG